MLSALSHPPPPSFPSRPRPASIQIDSVQCRAYSPLTLRPLLCVQSSSKRMISKDDWGRKLQAVKLRKEDMNRLVMNFLVTEVR